MKQYTPNSFQEKEKFASNDNLFEGNQRMQFSANARDLNLDFTLYLKKIYQLLAKYLVIARYHFFKQTQHSDLKWKMKLPFSMSWFQIAFLAFAAYIVFKKDLSFSVNMKSPEAFIADREDGYDNNANNTNLGFAAPTNLQDRTKVAFADAPEDDATTRKVKSYVRRFKDVAQKESESFGIPASIKMAQALVESNAGNSQLATRNNNHFGIKCFSKKCKKGHCSNFSDDHHKDFFRNYDSAWDSWREHSKFLMKGRYAELKNHGDDYRAWAHGLKDLGYATDPNYPQKLIEKIERYQLYLLDK